MTPTRDEAPPSPSEGEAEVRDSLELAKTYAGFVSCPGFLLANLARHCESLLAENARLRAELARRDAGGKP